MNTPLTLELVGDTQLVVKRKFAARPELVYRAHTDCDIIPRWMTGPDGVTMPVCQCDARPGGSIRYEWAHPDGWGFYLTGEFIELEPFSRIVHVERMFLPDQTPDNHIVSTFEPDGTGGTVMTMTMSVPDAATREAMLASGMADGMEKSYVRLEEMMSIPVV